MSQLILPGDAGPGDVLAGKKFCAGTVYNGQGTMPNNGAVSGAVASNGGTKTIPSGYTTGGTVTATTDSNLVANNIRSGISIFGVAGSYSAGTINPTGNATPTQVLSGTTFSSATYPNGSTGTMANNGAVTLTPGPSNVAIPAGYHNGSGIVSAVSVPAGNVLSGTTIAGTSGAMANNGAVVMTPGTANQAIATGYHNGSGYVKGDANLVTGNIKAGASIFGVAGKSSVVDTSDANAVASQILSGLYAYVNGVKLTGTIPSKTAQTYTPGTSAQTISAGQYLSGAQTISGDANLIAANILSGKSIFGVSGSYPDYQLMTASDATLASSTTTVSTSSTSMAQVKQFRVTGPRGIIRVKFDFGSGNAGTTTSAQVYKNGVAVGTLRTTSSTTFVTYTEDISFSSGDYIQIYASTTSTMYGPQIKNYYLCGTLPTVMTIT
ncbi:hypothetical protein REC12_11580 [Desulfosporosinus sp. PR]|uniref:hypothetical protein n=1 Tax=Candidatus Desulfosporosinus nitrosoreducens TaxID=3401928 RepID=UPI0027FEB148|nr:hypothetical protein [Desulfosporosinus sp. PR]MDQ7094230.1 hypothetical protein [Desulfosporosinus sp. PR]